LAPFLIYIFAGEERALTDAKILDIAKKHGGVVSLSVVVWETGIPLEEAEKCLKRFVKHEEAKESKEGDLRFYYFPSIIEQLGQINKKIIKLLLDNPSGLSKTDLLVKTDLSPESIKEALNRLGQKGIIYYDEENNIYKLTGITSTTNKERTAK
jgi:DNA-binding IclR family transcriptional regulator